MPWVDFEPLMIRLEIMPNLSTKPLKPKRGRPVSSRRSKQMAAQNPGRTPVNDGIDMVQAIGGDFGCVKSGDPRTVREKLAGFGREQYR